MKKVRIKPQLAGPIDAEELRRLQNLAFVINVEQQTSLPEPTPLTVEHERGDPDQERRVTQLAKPLIDADREAMRRQWELATREVDQWTTDRIRKFIKASRRAEESWARMPADALGYFADCIEFASEGGQKTVAFCFRLAVKPLRDLAAKLKS